MTKQQQGHGRSSSSSHVNCIPSEHGQLPKGYIPVLVGTGKAAELQRFLVNIEAFKRPQFVGLLNMAAREFGYQQKGVLTIPCDPQQFRQAAGEEVIRHV